MLESLLFLAWLALVSGVMLWAALNDRGERVGPLSSLFGTKTAPEARSTRRRRARARH